MQKKTLLIILLGISVIVVSSVVGLTRFRSKETASTPQTLEKPLKEVSMPQTPEETLKEIIKKNVKEEFLPSIYEVTGHSEYIPLEASEDDANYYFVEWDTEEARFSALVAYNKTTPKDLATYQILIFVKDPDLTGKKLSDKFLNYLPIEKWIHKGPSDQQWGKIEAHTVISTSNHNKIFTSITLLNFLIPNVTPHFPEIPIKSIGIISYQVYMPGSSEYAEVEDIQERFFDMNFPDSY